MTEVTKDAEAESTDTDIGMVVHSTVREHHRQGRNKEHVMWSLKNLGMSTYFKVDVDVRVEPSECKRGTKGDGASTCLGRGDGRVEGGTYEVHEGWYPTCDQSGQESSRRMHAVKEGGAIGSATSFGRSTKTGRGGRCECRIWWIRWSRWFEDMRWIW